MDILYFLLLIKMCLLHASLNVYRFASKTLPCAFSSSVYYNITDVSVIECGIMCYSNTIGTCDRYFWDPNGRSCMLFSNRTDMATFNISVENTVVVYSKFLTGCNDVGYDYDSETNTCLKRHVLRTDVTWKDARNHCQQDGGDLISIQTKAKWDLVANYVLSCSTDFWIGLKNRKWTTGDDYINVFNVSEMLNNYDSGFPTDLEPWCGALYAHNTPLQDESCNERTKTKFLCEILIS